MSSTRLWFACFLCVVASAVLAEPTTQSAADFWAGRIDQAKKSLILARAGFHGRMQSNPDYIAAAKAFAEAEQRLADAKREDGAVAAAAADKLRAKGRMDGIAAQLEREDPDMARATKELWYAETGMKTEAEQAAKREAASRAKELLQQRKARRPADKSIAMSDWTLKSDAPDAIRSLWNKTIAGQSTTEPELLKWPDIGALITVGTMGGNAQVKIVEVIDSKTMIGAPVLISTRTIYPGAGSVVQSPISKGILSATDIGRTETRREEANFWIIVRGYPTDEVSVGKMWSAPAGSLTIVSKPSTVTKDNRSYGPYDVWELVDMSRNATAPPD